MEDISLRTRHTFNVDDLNRLKLIYRITYSDGDYYQSFQYDTTMLCYDDTRRGLHRLTLLSYPSNKLLTNSIPKSQPYNIFVSKYPIIDDNIIVTQHIEGVIVNMFYDKENNTWKLAKGDTAIDYNTIIDAFKSIFYLSVDQKLNDIAMLEYLPKDCSYTFILKIPTYILYRNCQEPEIYLIAVYRIEDNISENISPVEYENWSILNDVNNVIKIPQCYDINDYSEVSL